MFLLLMLLILSYKFFGQAKREEHMTVINKLTKVTTNNQEAIDLLESWLSEARDGNIITVGIVGRRTGGEWQTDMSRSDNTLEDAAMLIELGMRRLGFVCK
jgi:hypothetical protein